MNCGSSRHLRFPGSIFRGAHREKSIANKAGGREATGRGLGRGGGVENRDSRKKCKSGHRLRAHPVPRQYLRGGRWGIRSYVEEFRRKSLEIEGIFSEEIAVKKSTRLAETRETFYSREEHFLALVIFDPPTWRPASGR
jgi:hypothetical protein